MLPSTAWRYRAHQQLWQKDLNGLEHDFPGYSALWSEVLNSPVDVQLAMFRQASAQPCADDVKTGFRAFAADLFARELVSMAEYVSIFGGTA